MVCSDLNRKEIQKGEDVCIHRSDSLYCTGEANKIL